jgi:LmbE family N-acetylglucosaminyl deacetylase
MKKFLKRLIIGTWRIIVPKTARNSLRLWLMLEMPDRAPTLIEDFSNGPVLVLAPHMDDEIIGPGGAVIRHVKSGSQVAFVYMTDGRAGDPEMANLGLPAGELARRKQELADLRKTESFRAAQVAGVKDLIFMDGPDGALFESPELVESLVSILNERKPKVIYSPAVTDNHRDHWATNRILRMALDCMEKSQTRDVIIRGYEVWTPLPANRMADITEVAEIKKQAIECFTTQTRFVNYSWTAMGLNQYRSMMHLHGRGHAEAFLETTVEEFGAMMDHISLERAALPETSIRMLINRPPGTARDAEAPRNQIQEFSPQIKSDELR